VTLSGFGMLAAVAVFFAGPAESGGEPQDVNELLGQFGDATESKGANLDELETCSREHQGRAHEDEDAK